MTELCASHQYANETHRMKLQPEIKCAVLDFEDGEAPMEGAHLIRGLVGPSTLLNAIGKILTQKAATQTI